MLATVFPSAVKASPSAAPTSASLAAFDAAFAADDAAPPKLDTIWPVLEAASRAIAAASDWETSPLSASSRVKADVVFDASDKSLVASARSADAWKLPANAKRDFPTFWKALTVALADDAAASLSAASSKDSTSICWTALLEGGGTTGPALTVVCTGCAAPNGAAPNTASRWSRASLMRCLKAATEASVSAMAMADSASWACKASTCCQL